MIRDLNWLVKLRWIALMLQVLSVPLALRYTYLSYNDLLSVICVMACTFIFNFLCQLNIIRPNALIHLSADLFAFCGLILLSGKVQNPFWDLIYFHIMMGAFILPRRKDVYYLPILFSCILFVFWNSTTPYSSVLFNFVPQFVIALVMWIAMRSLAILFLDQEKRVLSLESKRSLLEKHRQISLLVSGIVHELGTPLNTVRLKVDRVKGDDYTKRDIEILDKSLSKLESTTHQLNSTQIGLNQSYTEFLNLSYLVTRTIIMLEKDYSVEIKSKIEPNINLSTNALSVQLFLSTCVQNCVDEGLTQLSVVLTMSDGAILLKVSDLGAGFSDFVLANFKAPYNTTKGQGRGLGLYNCAIGLETIGGILNIYNSNGAVLELLFKGRIS